jgi:hypothetical protein
MPPQKTLTDITTRARKLHRRSVRIGAAEIGFSALLGIIFIATRSISPVVSTGIGFVGVAVMSVGTVGSLVVYGQTVRLRRELYRLEADYQ